LTSGVPVCAKTQERSYSTRLFQIRIVINEADFRAVTQGQSDQSVGNVRKLLGFTTAYGAVANHARIHVPAVAALNGLRLKIAAYQERLHFLTFERAQHVPQT
jgi:hypothetical protein